MHSSSSSKVLSTINQASDWLVVLNITAMDPIYNSLVASLCIIVYHFKYINIWLSNCGFTKNPSHWWCTMVYFIDLQVKCLPHSIIKVSRAIFTRLVIIIIFFREQSWSFYSSFDFDIFASCLNCLDISNLGPLRQIQREKH